MSGNATLWWGRRQIVSQVGIFYEEVLASGIYLRVTHVYHIGEYWRNRSPICRNGMLIP